MTADQGSTPAFRCSSISATLEEPLLGTASIATNWLLVEQPGPWGRDPIVQSRLPRPVARMLRARASEFRFRVVVLRRRSAPAGPARSCFFVHTGPRNPWLAHLGVGRIHDLLDVDLSPLGRGQPPADAEWEDEPLFVVCTNGRRDPCCAERGRPLATALGAAFRDRVWECSHIGGDRFAANLVCFPHGVYFGRVRPDEAVRVALGYQEGAISLPHYRGRACFGFAQQAAEHLLRTELRATGVDDLVMTRSRIEGDVVTTTFERGDQTYEVRVGVSRADPPRRVTCHAAEEGRPPHYELDRIDRVD